VDFEDFPAPEEILADPSERYYLYIGRLIKRKGIRIAVETCKSIGAKLLIAGAGCKRYTRNKLICEDGEVYEGDNGSLQYVGFADLARRVELYRGTIATFVPALCCEPFGAVVVESQACGTPVITTDWGAFPENVEHGKVGSDAGRWSSLSLLPRKPRNSTAPTSGSTQWIVGRWNGRLNGMRNTFKCYRIYGIRAGV
jgi:glycosyltransferase involved in cell wall biosynthesis